MSRNTRFSTILAATALLAAVAVLVIMVGMDWNSPGEVAYASDPGSDGESEDVVVQAAGGLTTRAIDLPAVQTYCRSLSNVDYDDCITVHQVFDALRGTSTAPWTFFTSPTTGRVIKLKLNSQKERLDGHIPAEIGELAMLEELWLHNNRLTGTLPSELGDLSNLSWLFLSNNELSGQIPQNLNKLELDRFWIHKNGFTGCVPYNLTLTREYKVDSGLAACAPPGSGATPTPTPATGTPTPTPTPTDETPTTLDLRNLENANCSASDLSGAFEGTYTRKSVWGPFQWEGNGEGWLASLWTRWVDEDGDTVECLTVVHDSMASQILNDDYGMLRRWTEYDWEVMSTEKTFEPQAIGDMHTFKIMEFDLGYYRLDVIPSSVLRGPNKQWAVAAGLFSRGKVTVMVSGWTNVRNFSPIHWESVKGPYDAVVEALRLIDSRREQWDLP